MEEVKSTNSQIKPVKLFSEEELALLRKINEKKSSQEVEDLTGYITHKKQCDLTKHQVSRERTKELFDEIVIGQ